MHSDERVHTTSCNAIFGVVDRWRTSFSAGILISEVPVSVWASNTAVVVILGLSAAAEAAVVGCDVAVTMGGSGCKTGGCGLRWGAMGWPGRECCCSEGAGGSFEAGEKLLVAVVDDIGIIDGGCAGVVSSDVATSRGVLRCMSRVCVAVSVVLRVAWVLKLTVVATSVWALASTVEVEVCVLECVVS
jgi:hypothetical protein